MLMFVNRWRHCSIGSSSRKAFPASLAQILCQGASMFLSSKLPALHLLHPRCFLATYVCAEKTNHPICEIAVFRELVVALCRQPIVNSFVYVSPEVWNMGWQMEYSGNPPTQVPQIPLQFLLEV